MANTDKKQDVKNNQAVDYTLVIQNFQEQMRLMQETQQQMQQQMMAQMQQMQEIQLQMMAQMQQMQQAANIEANAVEADTAVEIETEVPEEPAAVEADAAVETEVPEEPAAIEADTAVETEVPEEPAAVEADAAVETEVPEEPAAIEADTAVETEVPEEPAANTSIETEVPEESIPTSLHNYVISDDSYQTEGPKTKYRNNIAAIKTIRLLEQENRNPTEDERDLLAKWVGWGGLTQAFAAPDGKVHTGWEAEVAELEGLLSADEMNAAKASTLSAYYTPNKLIRTMWDAVAKLGFKGGRVLEPSAGSGAFIGLMPEELKEGTTVIGTELDPLTAKIANFLYPEAKIKNTGFETYKIGSNGVRMVIGNPPYGSFGVESGVRPHLGGFSIHNYFMAAGIDVLQENGIMAMVVSSAFMDAQNEDARLYIAKQAAFLGGVRLPSGYFKKEAGTEVTTDLVFFRKLTEAERKKQYAERHVTNEDGSTSIETQVIGYDWVSSAEVIDEADPEGDKIHLNTFFANNPEMVLGIFGTFSGAYGGKTASVIENPGQDTDALLANALGTLLVRDSCPEPVSEMEQQEIGLFDAGSTNEHKLSFEEIEKHSIGFRFMKNGILYERTGDIEGEPNAVFIADVSNPRGQASADRVVRLYELHDTVTLLRKSQLDSQATDTEIEDLRERLNTQYDEYVARFGFIHKRPRGDIMRGDPIMPTLWALESNFKEHKKADGGATTYTADKSAIFFERTQYPVMELTSVESAKDGLAYSLMKMGRVDLGLISELYGQTEKDVIEELGDLIFKDPLTEEYVEASEYLSGDVKDKLATAELMVEDDPTYLPNVGALQAIIPADVDVADLRIKPGAHWLPSEVIDDFILEVLKPYRYTGGAVYSAFDNKWIIPDFHIYDNDRKELYGTHMRSSHDLLVSVLSDSKITVTKDNKIDEEETRLAIQAADNIRRDWDDWILQSEERRTLLGGLYNDLFNRTVPRKFDGSHLDLEGKVDDSIIRLRPTQKNAVWRMVQSKSTLLDHVVGAGKTYAMVAGAMEMRRMGTVKKPLIVVPNHLTAQWGGDFARLYPNANILVVDKTDFTKENRDRFKARIAFGDWDAVIISHSQFTHIQMDPSFENRYLRRELNAIEDRIAHLSREGMDRINIKAAERLKKTYEHKLKKAVHGIVRDSDGLYWNELGVDALFVDEAHEFKNLSFVTNMNNISGLNSNGSQKALDMHMKISALRELENTRIVFATGTPISNTVAEMYTLQRYLDPEGLESRGFVTFDSWLRVFGVTATDWELSATGEYKLKTRISKFTGVPQLMQMYLSFADTITREDVEAALAEQGLKLNIPRLKNGKPTNIVVPRSEEQADFIGIPTLDDDGRPVYPEESLIGRMDAVANRRRHKKGDDNILSLMSLARKVALDMRLVDPTLYGDNKNGKVSAAVERIVQNYRQYDGDKGSQLVFLDLSTPKKGASGEREKLEKLIEQADKGNDTAIEKLEQYSQDEIDSILSGGKSFSVYEDIRQKLIEQGIPGDEIAFIHDADTDKRKEALFAAVNEGKVRVLLGSTSKMGAGMNVQERLVALHNIDAPWRPSDLEQRNGRIIRQGNALLDKYGDDFEIEIFNYATEKTMDAMQWQILERKSKFINQIRKGDLDSFEMEDISMDDSSISDMKAAASGNPLILTEIKLRSEIENLKKDKRAFQRKYFQGVSELTKLRNERDTLEDRLKNYEVLAVVPTMEKIEMSVNGVDYSFVIEESALEGLDEDGFKENDRIWKDAAEALLSSVKPSRTDDGSFSHIGSFNGFDLYVQRFQERLVQYSVSASFHSSSASVEIRRNGAAAGIVLNSTYAPRSIVKRLAGRIAEFPEAISNIEKRLVEIRSRIGYLEGISDIWPNSDLLIKAETEHRQVLDILSDSKKLQEYLDELKARDAESYIKAEEADDILDVVEVEDGVFVPVQDESNGETVGVEETGFDSTDDLTDDFTPPVEQPGSEVVEQPDSIEPDTSGLDFDSTDDLTDDFTSPVEQPVSEVVEQPDSMEPDADVFNFDSTDDLTDDFTPPVEQPGSEVVEQPDSMETDTDGFVFDFTLPAEQPVSGIVEQPDLEDVCVEKPSDEEAEAVIGEFATETEEPVKETELRDHMSALADYCAWLDMIGTLRHNGSFYDVAAQFLHGANTLSLTNKQIAAAVTAANIPFSSIAPAVSAVEPNLAAAWASRIVDAIIEEGTPEQMAFFLSNIRPETAGRVDAAYKQTAGGLLAYAESRMNTLLLNKTKSESLKEWRSVLFAVRNRDSHIDLNRQNALQPNVAIDRFVKSASQIKPETVATYAVADVRKIQPVQSEDILRELDESADFSL